MKFNKWEIRGVPLRIEIGPKDVDSDQVVFVERHGMKKYAMQLSTLDATVINLTLQRISNEMYEQAREKYLKSIVVINREILDFNSEEYGEEMRTVISTISNKKLCLIAAPTNSDKMNSYEKELKALCANAGILSTKSLCIPNSDALRYINSSNINLEQTYLLYGKSY